MTGPYAETWDALLNDELSRLDGVHLRRRRRVVEPIDATHVSIAGQRLINFAANDYLGLSHHPRVKEAAVHAVERYGIGTGAAPLITGYTPAHESAERAIAEWKGAEAAVLFSSGYQANGAIVQALAAVARRGGRGVRFLLDKLCHASLVDAVRAVAADAGDRRDSGATSPHAAFRVFPHYGVAKLQRLLAGRSPTDQSHAQDNENGPAKSRLDVIVTESVFSMDGDSAELQQIVQLKRTHETSNSPQPLLVLDEAHGSGVYGENGAGLAAELGIAADVDATVVTLSKAVGVIGAAVCGSRVLCDVLVNLGRPYIFSTSPPAAVAAAAEAAIAVMRDEPHRQQRVRQLAAHVRRELSAAGFALPPGDSPIIPIVLGEEQAALQAADRLREQGLLALPIRPPTVPRGASRLRVTLSSEHTDAEIESLLSALKGLPIDRAGFP